MTRETVLKSTLRTVMTEEDVDSFLSYEITDSDVSFLKEAINGVLSIMPTDAFSCATLSGLLGAYINDHSNIPVSVISGHLDYSSKRIFNCYKPIPYSTDKEEINEIWDGHCWVELNNLIVDISIFRTIYYGQVPRDLHENIVNKFGKGRGALVGTIRDIQKNDFVYTPCYCLTQDQISGLVRGAEKSINSRDK